MSESELNTAGVSDPPTDGCVATLKWEDVERMFGPEPMVEWDRFCRDTQSSWAPVLLMRRIAAGQTWSGVAIPVDGSLRELWADEIDCPERMRRLGKDACRCVLWTGATWWSRLAMEEARLGELRARDRSGEWPGAESRSPRQSREYHRAYLGQWTDDA